MQFHRCKIKLKINLFLANTTFTLLSTLLVLTQPYLLSYLLQQVKKFQLSTQAAAFSYETISASQLATSTMSESSAMSSSSSSQSQPGLSPGSQPTAPRDASSNKVQPRTSHDETNSFVSPVTMPLDQISSFRIFKSTVKNLPFNMEIYR